MGETFLQAIKAKQQGAWTGKMPAKRAIGRNTLRRNIVIYIMLAPAVLSTLIFKYLPLPGLVLSFMDYNPLLQFKSP